MRQRTMTVAGIFDLGLGDAEKGLVYLNLPVAQTLYNLRDQETEVAVTLEMIGQEAQRLLVGDDVVGEERDQRLVHALHAVVADRVLHFLGDLLDLARLDVFGDLRRVEHDLAHRHAPVPFGVVDQLHRDDGSHDQPQLTADLVLLIDGVGVDDPVDGLGGVVGVQGREDEVAGLRGGDRKRCPERRPRAGEAPRAGQAGSDTPPVLSPG